MEKLTEQEALVSVALVAAYADGTMGAEEDEALTEALQDCRALRGLDEDALRAAMQKADGLARRQGDDALLASAAASLRAELRPTAFCLAANLVLADDDVASEERAFIERLGRSLGLDPALTWNIVDVLRIRNRA